MSFLKSASLIIINSFQNAINRNDFMLLLLKRIVSSQSFAGKMVFPGGLLDPNDYNNEWISIINKRYSSSQLRNIFCKYKLPIYKASSTLSDMSPEIFYRICAIRETFEETGILLAIDNSQKPAHRNPSLMEDIKSKKWQENVSRDSDLFIKLFKSYNLTPDLLSLYDWSEWLTPSIVKRRFQTVFYISFFHDALTTHMNESESKDLFWRTPKQAVDEFSATNELAPPQISELFELDVLFSWRNVQAEADRRQKFGGISNISVIFSLLNGSMFVLPGDSRYPANGNTDEIITNLSDHSFEDLTGDKHLRRCFVNDGNYQYQYNLAGPDLIR